MVASKYRATVAICLHVMHTNPIDNLPDRQSSMKKRSQHEIVIVGGGVAGIHLATKLGREARSRPKISIKLVDAALTHVWKPSLHEFAAGSRGIGDDEVGFLPHSVRNNYEFRLGCLAGIDTEKQEVTLDPVSDDAGKPIAPRRTLGYDTLVLAIGSVCSDLGIPGVVENCLFLDNRKQAQSLHREFLNLCLRYGSGALPDDADSIHIAIVGGGATGVELAAEMREATHNGIDTLVPPECVRISVIEASDRLVPGLPDRLSRAVRRELENLDIGVYVNSRVMAVTRDSIILDGGRTMDAHLKIWAAGIAAPDAVRSLDQFEHDRIGRIRVDNTLQAVGYDNIFVLGDSACCPWTGKDTPVPPRAQAAIQQAAFMVGQIRHRLADEPLLNFKYRDRGSLVSIADQSAVGTLMGKALGVITFEGRLARWAYLSLYQMHLLTVLGVTKTIYLSIASFFAGRTRPRLKLH